MSHNIRERYSEHSAELSATARRSAGYKGELCAAFSRRRQSPGPVNPPWDFNAEEFA